MPLEQSDRYLAPHTVQEATQDAAGQGAAVLAGGTDLLPRWSKGVVKQPDALVSLKDVEGINGIARINGEVRVGALATMSEIASDPIIRDAAPVLANAAGRIACPQVRNRATIGGNLCNASPAADTAVPLILLDAVLDIAAWNGSSLTAREVPVTKFFKGPGATVLAPGELLTHIRFKPLAAGAYAAWDKFGTRPAMEIAVASVGVAVRLDGGTIVHARVGYGSVAPVPMRGRKAEVALMDRPLSAETIERCQAAARDEIAPITDVRASEGYRRDVVAVMLGRLLRNVES